MKYLNFFNFYGEDIHLYFNESSNYKTLSGGILSIIVIIFTTFIMAFNLIQFFTNRSVNVISQSQFSKEFQPIILTNDSYSVAYNLLNITDQVRGFIDYNLSVLENKNAIKTPTSVSYQNLSLSICSNSNVIEKMADLIDNTERKKLFKYLNLTTKTYCPILSIDKDYQLGGDFLYSGVDSLIETNFTISLTNFKYDNLDSFQNYIYFYMTFIDTFPNMTSSEGFSKFVNAFGISLDFTKDYVINIMYQNNRICTDEGYFYSITKNNDPFFNIQSISYSATNRVQVNGKINFYILINMDRH